MELCEDVLLHILKFIPNKSTYLSNFQLVCKEYKQVLQERLDKVYWKKVEKLVGKDNTNTNKMKQGSAFTGEVVLYKNQIDAKGYKHLAPALAKMTSLKKLYLGGNQIDVKGCKHLAPALAKMTALKQLNLGGNKIDAKGCEHLAPAFAKMTSLKKLYLYNNKIDAKGCEHLAAAFVKMTSLKKLYLGGNQIDAKGCKHLTPALTKMREAWKNAGKKSCDLYL